MLGRKRSQDCAWALSIVNLQLAIVNWQFPQASFDPAARGDCDEGISANGRVYRHLPGVKNLSFWETIHRPELPPANRATSKGVPSQPFFPASESGAKRAPENYCQDLCECYISIIQKRQPVDIYVEPE